MKTRPPFDGEIHAVSAKTMPDLNSPKREPGWFLGEPMTPSTNPARDEAVSTGWKFVPVEPTEEMIEAMREAARKASRGGISGMTIDAQFRAEHRPEYASYAAMLASAPAPASGVDAVAVKALRWVTSPRLGGRDKLIAIDCFGNEFARLDIERQTPEEIAAFKIERQADYEQRIRSALSQAATSGSGLIDAPAIPKLDNGVEPFDDKWLGDGDSVHVLPTSGSEAVGCGCRTRCSGGCDNPDPEEAGQ